MAYYRRLLVEAGGAINYTNRAVWAEGATLIIGLGGTGTDAALQIKKEVYRYLKPDDEDAILPKYSNIRYLVVDTDSTTLLKHSRTIWNIDREKEFFSLYDEDELKRINDRDYIESRPELSWLNYEHVAVNDHDLDGNRQVGRYLLVCSAEKIYKKLKTEMQNALNASSNSKLRVHICTGLSGATGSGIFLDICYLVRMAMEEIGHRNGDVCGYFFLPDINLSIPEIRENTDISDRIKINGYAALQELDYCMNFACNMDSFRMDYGFAKVDYNIEPVDLCTLVSVGDINGCFQRDAHKNAISEVAEFIINTLTVEYCLGKEKFDFSSFISVLKMCTEGMELQNGANVGYNILGASIAEMPLSEIATYLGAKLFENFRPMYDKTPTEKERDEFLVKNQLQYEDMRKYLTANCPGAVSFSASYDAKMYKARGNAAFVQRAADFLASNKGEMEKNLRTMAEEITEFNIPKESTSLISRTYKALCDSFVTSLDFGPFYAKRMLFGGNNQNLIHAVDGYIAKNNENLAHELRQNQLRDDEYEQAKIRMDSAGILNEKKRMEEYLNALNNLYVHHYKIEQFKAMNEFLEQYKKLLMKLDHNFFAVLKEMLNTLQNTFARNAEVLSEGIREEDTCTWEILSIKDIKEGLDEAVKNLDLDQIWYALMSDLLDNCKKWINQDENEISKLISDFILGQFQQATRKTMTDYLKEKFNVDNAVLLEQKIEDEIIQRKLWNKSIPLFWMNSRYNNPVGLWNILTVPYDSSEIYNAAKNFAEKKKITVRKSGITDKMSVMRFYSGLPMYAYQGIQELERVYEADKRPGCHLYERGECDWNLWLPSPVPESFRTGKPIERIKRKNIELIAEFEKAKELGVVEKDSGGNWNVWMTEDLDVDAVVGEITNNKDIAVMTAVELSEAIEELEKKAEEWKTQAEPLRIRLWRAVPWNEDQVMMDFYLMAPVLNDNVHRELMKRERLAEEIDKLHKYK
mgnify:CR=1 FL=1